MKIKKWLFAVLFIFSTCTVWAQTETTSADSLVLSQPVLELVNAENKAIYPPEYELFFSAVKSNSLGAEGKEAMLTMVEQLHKKGYNLRVELKAPFILLSKTQSEKKYSQQQLIDLMGLIEALAAERSKSDLNRQLAYLDQLIFEEILFRSRAVTILLKNADFELKNNKRPEYNGPEVYQATEAGAADSGSPQPAYDPLTTPMPDMFEEYGPQLKLKKGDLVFATYSDTFNLRGTEGYYLFKENEWRAQDGRLSWENVGISPEQRFARLKAYNFKLGAQAFEFSEALFVDRKMLDEPVSGDVLLNFEVSRSQLKTYPRFISYYANNKINRLESEKVVFQGGINFHGDNFYSRSKFQEPATLSVNISGKPKFKARGKDFQFNDRDSLISSQRVELTMYHHGDSIYHPAVSFYYDYRSDQLSVQTGVDDYTTTPFRSSYYNLDIQGDQVQWDLNADSLNLSINSAATSVPLIIESKDYFSNDRFIELAQIFGFHPLIMANKMAELRGDTFYINQMSKQYNINTKALSQAMKFLMANGMVNYEVETGKIELLEKGKHYNKASRLDPAYDYDDLLINSVIANAPNATISLEDSVMVIRGVENFQVSDSLDVNITPTNGEIRLLKNRDIEFDGSLAAGNFEFLGTKFKFKYDSFLVNLPNIESIKLSVELSEGEKAALANQLINTSGTLRINEVNNKSALRSLPQFPIFSSGESASVQFDGEEILDGAYDSTVYFDVPPFELDSVADADPTKYAFQGTLYSNGILPDFKEDLRVMEDNSLGFVHTIPGDGYNLYNTDAKLYGQVQLDNKGLTTPGNFEYLTGSFLTEKATLFIDSLKSEKGISASLKPETLNGVSFPAMAVEEYDLNWQAKKDSMMMKNLNTEKPFQIFEEQAALQGELILRSVGLFGKGEMQMEGSLVKSDSIAFSTNSFESKNTDFTLNAEGSSKPILSSQDVRINYDLIAQKAKIAPEVAGAAALDFPYAQYKTSIPTAEWDIQAQRITMTKPEDIPISQSFFYSTNDAYDSLVFSATDAIYDIADKELTVKGIPYIDVADAKIVPEGDSLIVLENSVINTLENAVILFDTATQYHRMFNAKVNIINSRKFEGEATYELVNAENDTFAIQFNAFEFIEEKERSYTRADGVVPREAPIEVSAGFLYSGDITMFAYREALMLDGAVKLDLKNLSERNIWIEYKSEDDIQEVIIPFDEALTSQGQPLNAGLHFDSKYDIYMSFITEKRNFEDDNLFVPKGGNLFYDFENGAYRIENPNKSEDPSQYFAGSMFSFTESSQEVTFEGKLNFLSGNAAKNVQAAGKGTGNLDSANFKVNAMIALSLGLPVEGLAAMGGDLKKYGEELGIAPALDDRSELIYRVAEFIGDDATRAWDQSFQTIPKSLANVSPDGQLLKDIVITDVELHWSEVHKAFYSKGKIGVSNISNIDVNREIDGFVEIEKSPEGDIITVFLEMAEGIWYYFTYDGFIMGAASSNDTFNGTIMSANSGKNKVGSFEPFTNTLPEVSQWVTEFRKDYYGIEEPYKLLMFSEANPQNKKKTTIEGDGF